MHQSRQTPPHLDFRKIDLPSPFINAAAGDVFERFAGDEFRLGLWTSAQHANARDQVHGGLIVTLADIALGIAIQRADADVRATSTIHIGADFVSAAPIGQWLEFRVRVLKIGGSIGFSEGTAWSDTDPVTGVNGVFKLRRASRGR